MKNLISFQKTFKIDENLELKGIPLKDIDPFLLSCGLKRSDGDECCAVYNTNSFELTAWLERDHTEESDWYFDVLQNADPFKLQDILYVVGFEIVYTDYSDFRLKDERFTIYQIDNFIEKLKIILNLDDYINDVLEKWVKARKDILNYSKKFGLIKDWDDICLKDSLLSISFDEGIIYFEMDVWTLKISLGLYNTRMCIEDVSVCSNLSELIINELKESNIPYNKHIDELSLFKDELY